MKYTTGDGEEFKTEEDALKYLKDTYLRITESKAEKCAREVFEKLEAGMTIFKNEYEEITKVIEKHYGS